MSMRLFRFLLFLSGFIHIAEGLALIVSLGFYAPCWVGKFHVKMFLDWDT